MNTLIAATDQPDARRILRNVPTVARHTLCKVPTVTRHTLCKVPTLCKGPLTKSGIGAKTWCENLREYFAKTFRFENRVIYIGFAPEIVREVFAQVSAPSIRTGHSRKYSRKHSRKYSHKHSRKYSRKYSRKCSLKRTEGSREPQPLQSANSDSPHPLQTGSTKTKYSQTIIKTFSRSQTAEWF